MCSIPQGDLKLWLQYVDFAKQNGRMQALSSIFGKVLALHPTTPGLWIMAAKFEFEEQKNTSSARTLLQQGLRANPESKHLWLEVGKGGEGIAVLYLYYNYVFALLFFAVFSNGVDAY